MNITITVQTQYIAEQSSESNHRFVFAYSINIENNEAETVKLLNRFWLITDANGKKVEVKGAGVVGEQPKIKPGESYQYTSGCVLETAVGKMEGYYQFETETKGLQKVNIPVFRLSTPNIIH